MKQFLRDLPLKIKLRSYALLMLIFLSISFIFASIALSNIGKELTLIVEEDIPLTQKLTHITVNQLEQAISVERALHYGAILLNEVTAKANFNKAIDDFYKKDILINKTIHEALEQIEHVLSVSQGSMTEKFKTIRSSLKDIAAAHESYVLHANEIFSLFEQNKPHQAEVLAEKIVHEEELLDKQVENLLFDLQAFTAQSAQNALQYEQSTISTLLVLGLISIVLGGIVSQLLCNFIVSGIRTAITTSQGDLRNEIQVTSKDEIGELLLGMNSMKEKLLLMVREISSITGQLSHSSLEMSHATTQTSEVLYSSVMKLS